MRSDWDQESITLSNDEASEDSDQDKRSIVAEEDSDFEAEVVTNVTQINNLIGAGASTEEYSIPEDWKSEEDSRIQECYDDMSLSGCGDASVDEVGVDLNLELDRFNSRGSSPIIKPVNGFFTYSEKGTGDGRTDFFP